MLIKFRNKMTMGLKKMIDDGARLGGLPSTIEVSPREALEIFREIHSLTPTPIGYVLTSKEGASLKLLFSAKEISDIDMMEYVNNWKDGDWKVEFQKIPVIIINPPPISQHLNG